MDVYGVITERIISLLESGTVPWRKPWVSGGAKNLVSGREYRGINSFILGAASYSSPYWATFNQIRERGGFVKKGERGSPVLFFRILDGERDDGREGRFAMARYYTCFNVEQTGGDMRVPEGVPLAAVEPIEACDRIVAGYANAPTIRHGESRAYYAPKDDRINMPRREVFESAEAYYSTLFHELSHSTGHASRLARKGVVDPISYGSHAYSKEELVAEMGSAFLCGATSIAPAIVENSAAYIASWLRRLRDDRKLVVEAAAQAQKAADLILGKHACATSEAA